MATTTTNGFLGGVMLAWAIAMLGLTVCLVIWGLAIWHLIRFKDVPNRMLWLFIVILFPVLGATAYYFGVMLPYNRAHPYIRPKATDQ